MVTYRVLFINLIIPTLTFFNVSAKSFNNNSEEYNPKSSEKADSWDVWSSLLEEWTLNKK